MRTQRLSLILALVLTSCNLTATQETSTPLSPQTLNAPTLSLSTFTSVPTGTPPVVNTPTIAPTPTSSFILASPKEQPVNCRFGPGVSYAVIGALEIGGQAEMIGRNEDASWWYVKNPSDPSAVCWLSAEFIVTVGNVAALPVVGPPEIGVSNIHVTVDPALMSVNCGAFPQSVSASAEITTNGPSVVTWRWEMSTGKVFAEETLLFESASTKTVEGHFTVDGANDYWVNLHILLPNDRSGGEIFKVTCVP